MSKSTGFPVFQSGMALLIENGHLLQQTGYNRELFSVERAGSSQQLHWIENAAELSISRLAEGTKTIGMLIAGYDRTIGAESEILYGLAGLLQEIGDGVAALQNVMQAASEGKATSRAREDREATHAATHQADKPAARKEAAPC
ncbi:hypothetical protein QU481_14030 [Crenobacter sp. SG2303]|uniref:Uncharacterized protein n=1 Tax=Crenobacter oryzisoli TaxID=3056844 RepID=A0ABT7XQD6_9NEIS|nr:hypothetical protein [Crenobacter sp. SG2303]MDN0076006.1 hypothetical protein [Crenobacter sp. SG2303]